MDGGMDILVSMSGFEVCDNFTYTHFFYTRFSLYDKRDLSQVLDCTFERKLYLYTWTIHRLYPRYFSLKDRIST